MIVLDNTFWAGFRHDLLIEDSTNIVVGPNNLDRNPRYSAEDRGRANRGGGVRNCADSTLTGLHVNGVRHAPAGVRIENCRRLNVTNCTILDCDNAGRLGPSDARHY